MAVARQLFVSLGCDDAAALAEFWAMLGGEVKFANCDRSIRPVTPSA